MVSKHAEEGARLLKLGLFEDAAEVFERGLAEDPEDKSCLLGLSRTRLAQRRIPEAKELLLRLDKLHPNHPEVHVHLSRIAFEEGDLTAVDRLRALASRQEAGFPEFYNLGLTLADLGLLDEAATAFGMAAQAVPESPYAFFNLGLVLQRKGDLDGALKCFKMARQLAPNQLQPYLRISSVLVAKGDVATAAKALQRALEVLPGAPELYEELVKVAIYADAPKQAVRAAIELRTRRPKDPNAAYLHALALIVAGDLEGAQRVLGEAEQLSPGHWQLKLAGAKIYFTQKQYGPAVRLLEEARALAQGEPGPPTDLSTILLVQGQVQKARQVLEEALKSSPEDPGLNLNMALALQQEEPARAAEHARKALASGDPGARAQAERLLKLLGAPVAKREPPVPSA